MKTKPQITKIDELTLKDHHHLTKDDSCWYYGDYTPNKQWSFSPTNQLIGNYKKGIDKQGTAEWNYKLRAVQEVGYLFAEAVQYMKTLNSTIFVPVPPSKIQSDPGYDPRIVTSLEVASHTLSMPLPISNCIVQNVNAIPDHQSNSTRLRPEERAATYSIQMKEIPQLFSVKRVFIFDDVITTGSHYKGVELALKRILPNAEYHGIFVARRVVPNPFMNINEFFKLKNV